MTATCRPLRTGRFAGRRHHATSTGCSTGTAGPLAEAGTRTHSGACAKAGTCAGCSARGRAASRMHGTACAGTTGRAAGCSTGTAGALAITTASGSSAGTAIKNGTSALDASGTGTGRALRRNRNGDDGRRRRCSVDRAWTGLRHNDAARSRNGSRRDWSRRNGGRSSCLGFGCCRGDRFCGRSGERRRDHWRLHSNRARRRSGNHGTRLRVRHRCGRVTWCVAGHVCRGAGGNHRRLRDHRPRGRLRGNRRSRRRRGNNLRRLARLGNDSARCRFGLCRRSDEGRPWGCRCRGNRCSGSDRSRRRNRSGGS